MSESSQRRFRTSRITQLSLGAAQQLVHLPDADKTVIVDAVIAGMLDRCRTFRTLEDHAREVCAALSIDQSRKPSVVQALQQLSAGGLLVALEELVGAASAPDVVPPISTVGIVTKDRPDALQDALVSYVEHCQHHGRDVEYVVCDDSESATAREECRNLARSVARRRGATVSYAGSDEKRRYAAELARAADVAPGLVEFALLDVEGVGCSIGANRNAMLLHCAGELMYGADDDTVCRVVRHPQPAPRLRLRHGDPLEIWCYPSREAALAAASYDERCLLSLHEQLLGRSLSAVLNATEREPDYDGLCDHQLGMLLRGKGNVVLTQSGVLGDSGMNSGARFLVEGGATRARIVQSEAAYRSAMTSREVLRVAQLSVGHAGSFTGAGFGLDLRATVPPFVPVGRAEDTVFGAMVTQMSDEHLFGYPEAAVLHLPKESRSFAPNHTLAVAGNVRFAEALMSLFPEGEQDARDPRPLRELSERLISVGRQDDRRFKATMRHALWNLAAKRCSMLEATLQAHRGSPAYWAKDVEAFLAAVRASVTSEDFWIPTDLRDGRSAQESAALMRRLILKVGQLLDVWPELLQAAKSLRVKGRRLGVPL